MADLHTVASGDMTVARSGGFVPASTATTVTLDPAIHDEYNYTHEATPSHSLSAAPADGLVVRRVLPAGWGAGGAGEFLYVEDGDGDGVMFTANASSAQCIAMVAGAAAGGVSYTRNASGEDWYRFSAPTAGSILVEHCEDGASWVEIRTVSGVGADTAALRFSHNYYDPVSANGPATLEMNPSAASGGTATRQDAVRLGRADVWTPQPFALASAFGAFSPVAPRLITSAPTVGATIGGGRQSAAID